MFRTTSTVIKLRQASRVLLLMLASSFIASAGSAYADSSDQTKKTPVQSGISFLETARKPAIIMFLVTCPSLLLKQEAVEGSTAVIKFCGLAMPTNKFAQGFCRIYSLQYLSSVSKLSLLITAIGIGIALHHRFFPGEIKKTNVFQRNYDKHPVLFSLAVAAVIIAVVAGIGYLVYSSRAGNSMMESYY